MSSTSEPTRSLEIFYSYAHEDERLRKALDKQLSLLKRDGLITDWYDHKITAGKEWESEILTHLDSAQIILLLISPDFIASDYCYSIEMQRAMERHERGEARVIPIILRPADWKSAVFGKLKALPSDGKPVTRWSNRDEAFLNVAKGIRRTVRELAPPPTYPTKAISSLRSPNTLQQNDPNIPAPYWNIPHPRNPFFTGRENILDQLHGLLRSNTAVAMTQPQAISGLGGIGKTQIASEYAYRYRSEYQVILWANCSFREELVADFVAMAGLLNLPEKNIQNLPEKNIQNQSVAINAVKRWLETHTDWLLILDNADDLAMVRDYIPFGNKGHILLTSRSQTMGGLAHKIEIEKMGLEDGVLFLLRRAAIIAHVATLNNVSETDHAQALEIVKALDGLPLALDQAGAYIEETKCGLSSYFILYRAHRAKFLNRRGGFMPGHPEPVATTWSLSFENVERATLASVELLRLCSFLAPDAIPEEILTEGTSYPGTVLHLAADPSELNAAIAELLKYSLIQRDNSRHILTIHRLVQAVLKDEMDEDAQRLWAEYTVKAVSHTFQEVEFEVWPHCQRLLPHAQICKNLIEEWNLDFPESARLLYRAGRYLLERTQYLEAEPLVKQALAIREKVLGPEHPDTATSIADLGWLYQCQGKYEQAEPLVRRALAIRDMALGPEDVNTATSLNNLAMLYYRQGKYEQAKPLARRALAIREIALGPENSAKAISLNDLINRSTMMKIER